MSEQQKECPFSYQIDNQVAIKINAWKKLTVLFDHNLLHNISDNIAIMIEQYLQIDMKRQYKLKYHQIDTLG